jgi:uncharacterized protein YidB (DUF937 family)
MAGKRDQSGFVPIRPFFRTRNEIPVRQGTISSVRRFAKVISKAEGAAMGLLGQLISGLADTADSAFPLQTVLMDPLTRNQHGGGYAFAQPPGARPAGGGLGELISMFENAGLGQLAQSWGSFPRSSAFPPSSINSRPVANCRMKAHSPFNSVAGAGNNRGSA